MNELLIALILGIVEGLTEFLPVSSTGHMILVAKLLSFEGERAHAFEVFIQLGAILSVLFLYKERFYSLIPSSFNLKKRDPIAGLRGMNGVFIIAAGCLPVFLLGFLLRDAIKFYLFNDVTVASALIFGGICMVVIEKMRKIKFGKKRIIDTDALHPESKNDLKSFNEITLETMTLRAGFYVGIFQCLALWPGMSRSASTIIGGLLLGMNRKAAAEFSFLVSVPVMMAATAYDLYKSLKFLTISDLPLFIVGFIVSFIVAVIAIKSFIAFLGRYTFIPFAIYRIIVGLLVLFLVFR
jgi:undecaprenyl-diphosphatase